MLVGNLDNIVRNPFHPLYNFKLGKSYEDIGQTTSACSYYLRCAEFSNDNLLSYEALLRLAICIDKERERIHTLKGILLRAISLMPNRPEAYHHLAKVYEFNKDWHESYMTATIGVCMADNYKNDLLTDVGYYGKSVLLFQKAIAGWWVGLFDESMFIFRTLSLDKSLPENYKRIVNNNIQNYGSSWKRLITYENAYHNDIRYKFKGSSNIDRNYSQCYQDMFVLSMLNGKTNGKYVEIGACDPVFNNNTYLLEKDFGWTGIALDINEKTNAKYNAERKNKSLTLDATLCDYEKLLTEDAYDYLQIDCDPASTSYKVLLRIPFHKCRFAVITFEHEFYCDENIEVRDLSRKYLISLGYEMMVDNISEDDYSPFEDWWVNPSLVDNKIIDLMRCVNNDTKRADKYFLNKIC